MEKAFTVLVMMMIPLASLGRINHDQSADAEVRRMNTEEREALLHGDTKTLATLWSDDLVVGSPTGEPAFAALQRASGAHYGYAWFGAALRLPAASPVAQSRS